jgi:acetamidase/formamidase
MHHLKTALTACVLAFVPAVAFAEPEVAGTWALYAIARGEVLDATRLQLSVTGNTVAGRGKGFILSGSQDNADLHLTATREDGSAYGTVEIHIDGSEGKGVMQRKGATTEITLHRLPSRSEPKTVTFTPTDYHRTFGGVEPVLRINAGDTVKTATLDSAGLDGSEVSRSPAGNPQNGPIYVDGAIPGDTLAVTIKRIRLNKPIARSGNTIMPSALTPEYFRGTKLEPQVDGKWKLDLEEGTGVLANPSERLKDFKVQLKPMIGGMGVAPARNEVFRTQQLGYWGGNLDYSGLHEGTTVYLPVSREGALLQVGDVHALQGDGELAGDALETSAELELLIDVIPGPATKGPRAEDADYLMAMGVAGSMEAALRMATTHLIQWLERDYSLTHSEAAIVLSSSMKYEIAEVVDPQFHIVAKISKAVLAPLKRNAKP